MVWESANQRNGGKLRKTGPRQDSNVPLLWKWERRKGMRRGCRGETRRIAGYRAVGGFGGCDF